MKMDKSNYVRSERDDEQVRKITVKIKQVKVWDDPPEYEERVDLDSKNTSKPVTRFVLRDMASGGHYRTRHPLGAYNAWTRFYGGARLFQTRKAGKTALRELWATRLEMAEVEAWEIHQRQNQTKGGAR